MRKLALEPFYEKVKISEFSSPKSSLQEDMEDEPGLCMETS